MLAGAALAVSVLTYRDRTASAPLAPILCQSSVVGSAAAAPTTRASSG